MSDDIKVRRMIARLVQPRLAALTDNNLSIDSSDGIMYRVAGRAVFYPIIGYWRLIDESRRGYGVKQLIVALTEPPVRPPSIADELIERLRQKHRKKTEAKFEKPATGRDSGAASDRTAEPTTAISDAVIAESAAGASSTPLPLVTW